MSKEAMLEPVEQVVAEGGARKIPCVKFGARSTTMSGTRTSVDCSSPQWLSGCRRSIAFSDLDLCKELLAKFERAGKVQNTAEMVAWKRRRSQQRSSKRSVARKTNHSKGTSDCDATRGAHHGDDSESSGNDHQPRA